jgi:Helicase associated domain
MMADLRDHTSDDWDWWTEWGYPPGEEYFSRLCDYVKVHGHANVPVTYAIDGYNLGEWVRRQRRAFADSLLEADRQGRLQKLPG